MPESTQRPNDGGEQRRSPEDYRPVHPDVEYEKIEPSLLGIIAVLIGFAFLFGGVALVALWYLAAYETPADRRGQLADYSTPAESLPPEPRLEPLNDVEGIVASDIRARHLVFERVLHSYGKMEEEGFVHIPIEKAMELTAERLPMRESAGEAEKTYGLLDGGEPNSGRLFLEAPPWFRESE